MNAEEIIKQALAEDIGTGDHSSLACIAPTLQGTMHLLAKEKGIIAGISVAKKIIEIHDHNILMVNNDFHDGDSVCAGDMLFSLTGSAQSMLAIERTLLNFMQRMSGIATHTRRCVNLISDFKTQLLDTRKTTPNMRLFEKQAVLIGGAENHRLGLYDMIMLKDNHIDFAGGIENAIDRTCAYLKNNGLTLKVEIEARNLEQVRQIVARGDIHRIMFDNFTPAQICEALKIVNNCYETEASGNIAMDSLREYAATGVDFISMGALTHHIKSLDLSLKFKRE